MPLYEYRCDACGHRFEVIRQFSDPPLDKCPTCGGGVHKLFSSPAIQFKGSGFYITDYAKKDQAAAAEPGESKSDDTSSKDQDKGDKSDKSEKSDKTEKSDKSEKTSKGDKGSATTDPGSPSSSKAPPPSPTKEST